MFENARVMPCVLRRGKDCCWPIDDSVQISHELGAYGGLLGV